MGRHWNVHQARGMGLARLYSMSSVGRLAALLASLESKRRAVPWALLSESSSQPKLLAGSSSQSCTSSARPGELHSLLPVLVLMSVEADGT